MTENIHPCREPHRLAVADQSRNVSRTGLVLILTLVMMAAEIAAGWIYGSMALLADGWHMATHAAVLGGAVFAYSYARRHAANAAYTFGTGKVGDLAAFTSAILLCVVALLMAIESFERMARPIPIEFRDAMVVAVIGLIVNLVSAWLLRDDHHHGHEEAHDHGGHAHASHAHHEHHEHARDHNRDAAYAHVLADAFDLAENRVERMLERLVDRVALRRAQLLQVAFDAGACLCACGLVVEVAGDLLAREDRLRDVIEHAQWPTIAEPLSPYGTARPHLPRCPRQ